MKYLKSYPIYIILLLFLVKTIPTYALDLDLHLAQLTSPTTTPSPTQVDPTAEPSPKPSVQPSPTNGLSPTAQPSQTPTPTDKPTLTVTAGVSVTVNPTEILSPTKTASQSPTQKPPENVGGSNTGILSSTPEPQSPTATPTVSPSPTPTSVPVVIGKTDSPVKSAAEQIFKKVIVPPLSFILKRPQEDFYKENQITKPTSYGLVTFAAFGMIGGIWLLFPSQIMGLYSKGKDKFTELFATNSNKFSIVE